MSHDTSDVPRFFPVAIDIQNKRCLVVGGGNIGTRKALTLDQARASVTVVSPDVTGELNKQIDLGKMQWIKDIFRKEHVEGAFLVIAATDDEKLNEEIVHHASQCGALVCDTSSAKRSELIFGAMHNTADTTVVVFTDGRDPSRARKVRDRIAQLFTRDNELQS